ncbi:hypothetical protein P8452_08735 [Trifolium repens]|nr:hypothetical protein P8452_08735 [Trifolium repens]
MLLNVIKKRRISLSRVQEPTSISNKQTNKATIYCEFVQILHRINILLPTLQTCIHKSRHKGLISVVDFII